MAAAGILNLPNTHCAGATEPDAASLGFIETRFRSLRNQVPLQFREGIPDLEEAFSHWRGRIDPLSQDMEIDPCRLELVKDFECMAKRPKGPIHFPDNEGVARAKGFERLLKPVAALCNRRDTMIGEYAVAS